MGEGDLVSVFVFLGYGAFETPEPAMAAHLRQGAAYCNAVLPDIIVFTGGCSRMKKLPERSEAQSMKEYVEPLLKYVPIILIDEEALTTLDNLRNTNTKLKAFGLDPRSLLVNFWCDASRAATIKLIGKPIFGEALRVRIGSTNVVQDSALKCFLAKAVTWLASKNSLVNERFRAMRRKDFAKS